MDGIDRKKVDRRDRHSIRKAGSISIRQQIQTTRSKMQAELDLLMIGGEGSSSAVLGGFSGVEGGLEGRGMGMGMGLEERVGMGMGRMAERMEALEARVAELEAQLSEKKTVAVVSTPVKTVVKTEKTAPPAPVKTVAKKEKTAAPVAAAPIPLDAPTPASYRLSPSVVAAHTKCQARKEPPQGGAGTGWDKRFTPSVFWERLCQSEPETDGLCTTCLRYRDQNPKKWHGLITEEPLPESHMLGTAWAEKKCKWTGSATGSVSAPVSSAASVASEASEEEGSAVVLTPAPVSASTVAPMDPAQTAAAAAAQAKKEAAAVKRKATIAKKKEAAAATPAPVAAVAVVTLGTAAVTTAVVAAVSTTEPVADAGELKLLQGEFYWVVGSNAYEYDQIEEKPGAFAGLVRADETIDGDAEEEGAAESDGE